MSTARVMRTEVISLLAKSVYPSRITKLTRKQWEIGQGTIRKSVEAGAHSARHAKDEAKSCRDRSVRYEPSAGAQSPVIFLSCHDHCPRGAGTVSDTNAS